MATNLNYKPTTNEFVKFNGSSKNGSFKQGNNRKSSKTSFFCLEKHEKKSGQKTNHEKNTIFHLYRGYLSDFRYYIRKVAFLTRILTSCEYPILTLKERVKESNRDNNRKPLLVKVND